MKAIRKFGIISVLTTLLVCGAIFSLGDGAKKKAFAGEIAVPPAELIVDFEDGDQAVLSNGDVTISNGKAVLKNDGIVTAKEKFLSFRLYVSVKIEGSLKISFGNVSVVCGEKGFSAQGAGETFAEGSAVSGEVLIALTVSGGRIEAGVRRSDEPQEWLYETAFSAVIIDKQSDAVAPSFSAESGSAEIDYFEIFSLEGSVPSESEDYDPSHDSKAFDVKPLKDENKKGCSGGLQNCLAGTVLALSGVVIAVICRKSRQTNKNRGKK